MKIKITAISNNVYRFADKTISDELYGTWRGRIVNAPEISRSFSDLGSIASTLYIQLINHDNQIPFTEDLWNASVEVESDNGYKWVGNVSAYETNADGKMYITATERTAPEYSRYIPDEFARLVSIDQDVHISALNVTIPTIIGGNADNPIPVKGILKSKSDAIYYLCIGEIHEIVNVRVGDKTMTRAQAESNGYMCYTGSASQTNEPGIAYIQITDTSKRLNDDGSYVEIGAEVIGLKLGTHTVAECRNGARFLYWLLKTASTGICGWGLGIDESQIDTTSFNTAIAYVDSIGLKLDGVMYDNRSAQSWIDEICRVIRGTYEIGSDGKRRLTIDVASTSAYIYTKDNIELVRFGAGAYTGRVYNKGVLNYSYNPVTGMFMQSANYQNAESIARIDEQLFEGESYFIRDAETAQKILEYTCKKSLVEANKILFNTRFLPQNCKIGTVITVNYPEKGMNNALFKITSLQIGDHVNKIEAVKYDSSIYTSGSASATVAWQNEQPIVSPVSVSALNSLTLNSGYDIQKDGTSLISITGSFTMPSGKYLTAVVEYGETATPSEWIALGFLKTDNFRISPVKANTLYSVRVRLLTSNGHSDYITDTITTVGDSTAPSVPTVVAYTYLKTIRIEINLSSPPDDLAGFEIYRSTVEGQNGEKIGYVASTNGTATYIDTGASDYYTYFYYSAKAVDTWNNKSDYSSQSRAICSKIVTHDIEASAIYAESFATAENVGENVDGVKFDSDGLQGWYNHQLYFFLKANERSVIGGWNIGFGSLYSDNIELKSNGALKTMDYTSGFKGWYVGKNGDAEFNNIRARGTIKSTVFEYDEVSVIGGQQLVSPGGVLSSAYNPLVFVTKYASSKLDAEYSILNEINDTSYTRESVTFESYQDFYDYEKSLWFQNNIILDYSQFGKSIYHEEDYSLENATAELSECFTLLNQINDSSYTMPSISSSLTYSQYVELENGYWDAAANINDDPPEFVSSIKESDSVLYLKRTDEFSTGDIIRIKDGLSNDFWGKVVAKGTDTTGKFISVVALHNSIFNMEAGQTVVNYGKSTNGGILLDGNAPKVDIYTHDGEPWNGLDNWVRLGNLKGIGDVYDDRFGLFIGRYSKTNPDYHYLMYDEKSGKLVIRGEIIVTGSEGETSISGDAVKTGALKSQNLVGGGDGVLTTSGTLFNLNYGYISSKNFYVKSDGSVKLTGEVIITSGSTLQAINGKMSTSDYCITNNNVTYINGGTIYANSITSEKLSTDAIKSRNFTDTDPDILAGKAFSTAGSFFNLANGTLTAPKFRFGSDGSCGIGIFNVGSSGQLEAIENTNIGQRVRYVNWDINQLLLEYNISGSFHSLNLFNSFGFSTTYHGDVGNVRSSVELDASNTGARNSAAILQIYPRETSNTGLYVEGVISSAAGACTGCDESVKKKFKDVSTLNKLKNIRVKKFKYSQKAIKEKEWLKKHKAENKVMPVFKDEADSPDYIMAMAGEFNKTFGVDNNNDESINYTNAIGVALRAIQELAEQLDGFKRQYRFLKKIMLSKGVVSETDIENARIAKNKENLSKEILNKLNA